MDQLWETAADADASETVWGDERYAGWADDDIYAEVAKLPWPTEPEQPLLG